MGEEGLGLPGARPPPSPGGVLAPAFRVRGRPPTLQALPDVTGTRPAGEARSLLGVLIIRSPDRRCRAGVECLVHTLRDAAGSPGYSCLRRPTDFSVLNWEDAISFLEKGEENTGEAD